MTRLLPILVASLVGLTALAQSPTAQVTGRIADEKNEGLIGVPITLMSTKDTTQEQYALTDTAGRFQFESLPFQTYRLRATYLGFQEFTQTVSINQLVQDLGSLRLVGTAKTLNEVTVVGQAATATQKGDTLQFNATAFKVNKDASAEDLIQKMPGISIVNGRAQAQGEDVQRVLVDGKPFFGDDPTVALRNLPAEVIDKIEVFDRLSDQSQFTGFNDGNTSKTINIVTRADRRNGTFGRLFAGGGQQQAGGPGLYSAGATINRFNNDRRLTVIGLSNNLNQQNFAAQDLVGTNSGGGNGGGQGGNGGRGGRGGGGQGGGRGGNGGGGDGGGASNFLVGQQGGISRTNSLGLNYSDDWGKYVTFRGSYFFNNTNNRNEQSLLRTYYLSENTNQFYREQSANSSTNYNHRFDFRIEYTPNSTNSLLLTPRLSFQNNRSDRNLLGTTLLTGDSLQSQTQSMNAAHRTGLTFSNDALFRHRFAKRGRTLSLNLGTNFTNRDGLSSLRSVNEFYTPTLRTQLIDQQTVDQTNNYQLSANANYTEPLTRSSQLQLNYSVSYTNSDADRRTYRMAMAAGRYDLLDSLLSNATESDYIFNRAGVGYNLRNQTLGVTLNLSYQRASLTSDQLFPRPRTLQTLFNNLLPSAQADYRFTQNSRLRMNYRTNVDAPNVNQLQSVIDNSNPLLLSTGNPDLKQAYGHNLSARYTLTNPGKASSFFALLSGSYTNNYIGNAILIGTGQDSGLAPATFLPSSVTLGPGVQLTRPVNLAGALSTRSFVTYGRPIRPIKTNINLTLGFNYNRTPGIINNRLNFVHNYVMTQGVVLSSNISPKLDFTLSYNLNYNWVNNTIQSQLNNNFLTQSLGGRVNWLFGKGWLLQSDLNSQSYRGLSASFNQTYTIWNASFGRKFLNNQRGELKTTVFDLLNQNSSIGRNVTDTYVEDTRSLVLQQYFLLTFTYRLNKA